MPRVHLFEFEDLSWFKKTIRNYLTYFLQFLSNLTPIQIIDLCSGGGSLLWLNPQLKQSKPSLKITLTDFYPNTTAFEHKKIKLTILNPLTPEVFLQI